MNYRRNTVNARLEAAGLSERCAAELNQTNELALVVGGFEQPSPQFEVVWREDRMPEATARLLTIGLQEAFRAFTSDPRRALGTIALLSEHQRASIEVAAKTRQQIAPRNLAHALLEERIREQPDAPAVEQHAMLRRLKVQSAIVAETLVETIAPHVSRIFTFGNGGACGFSTRKG